MLTAVKEDVIARVNDAFRKVGIGFVVTPGIQDLPDVCGLIDAVQEFDEFMENNDPHGEHDFGKIRWHGETVFWKIDYYDREMKYWADPLSAECRRVLTVMLASEY